LCFQTTFEDGAVSLWPAILVVSMLATVLVLCCLQLSRKQKSDWSYYFMIS